MKTILTSLLCCLLVSVTYSQQVNKGTQDSTKWITLQRTDYSVKYPANWELNESGVMNTSFVLLAEQEGENDQFRENVTLIKQDLTGYGIKMDDFVRLSETQVTEMIENGKILESRRLKKSGKEFHYCAFTGKQGVIELLFEQYYCIQNETAYIVTFTCEQRKTDKYQQVGKNIIESFIVK